MPRIEEVFNTNELINYFKERTVTPMLGESLFPERKIQDIEFDMILGTGGLPVTAQVHAYDSKTQLASREAMRMEALSSGKIKIEENGIKVTIDYGIPTGNKKAFNWTDVTTSKPLDDLETLASAVETECGSRPSRALTSRKIAKSICSNESVRKAINGVNSDKIITLSQLNELLVQCDLPIIITYEGKYKVEGAKGFITTRYFPENVISMFGDSTLGETIYGLTAEEVKLIGDGKMEEASMVGNIFVGTYTSIDPVGEITKAAATAIPSFPHGEELGIGTITLA